jgi:hypothetical protein
MHVLVMYWFVFGIDLDRIDCYLESMILTDMHMSMDPNSICSHHSNSVFYSPHISDITQPIRDDLMAIMA